MELSKAINFKKQNPLLFEEVISQKNNKLLELYQRLADAHQIPFKNLLTYPPDENLLKKEDLQSYLKLEYLPYQLKNGKYILAVADITENIIIYALKRYKNFEFVLTTPNDIRWTIESRFASHHIHLSCEELFKKAPEKSAKHLSYWILALTPLFFIGENSFLIAVNITYFLFLSFKWLIFTAGETAEKQEMIAEDLHDYELPIYTVLVPLYKEHRSLPKLTNNLRKLDYPRAKLDIKLIIEEDDKLTLQTAKDLELEAFFEIIKVPPSQPRTKPKACNYALKFARGEFITIYDAEDKPDPLQLKKAVHKFRNSDAVCLQARLNYYNFDKNILTSLFSVEYSAWFEYMLQGLAKFGFPIPLGGTSNHIRFDKLTEVGAWDPYNVTEDADLGMRLERAGYKTAMLDCETAEEAPHRLTAWLKQRTRWIKGYMQTYLVHMRHPFRLLRDLGLKKFIGFQCFIGLPAVSFLTAPFLIILCGLHLTGIISAEIPSWLFILCGINFIAGILVHWSFGISVYLNNPKERKSLLAVMVFPFYWLLHSAAAFRAVYQLIKKPHFWDKTEHGFE